MLQDFIVREVVDSPGFERLQKCSGELAMAVILISELLLPTGGQKDMRLETTMGETGVNFPTSGLPDVLIKVIGDGVIKLDGAMDISSFVVNSSPGSGMTTVKNDTLYHGH